MSRNSVEIQRRFAQGSRIQVENRSSSFVAHTTVAEYIVHLVVPLALDFCVLNAAGGMTDKRLRCCYYILREFTNANNK